MPTGETIEGVRIIVHREPSGWWAESPDVEGWSVAGETYEEIRQLVVDGVGFACQAEAPWPGPGRLVTNR